MGTGKHNQTQSQTEKKLSRRAESFPSSIDSQNQSQAPKRRLVCAIPASQKQDLSPQPGQKNTSTPVAFAHRFDRWGRNPDEKNIARNWQNWSMFADSKGEQTIERAIIQSPYFLVIPGDLAPESKTIFK